MMLTPPEHEHPAAIDEAATWLSSNWLMAERPLLPCIRRRFGLSPVDAVEAIRTARKMTEAHHGNP